MKRAAAVIHALLLSAGSAMAQDHGAQSSVDRPTIELQQRFARFLPTIPIPGLPSSDIDPLVPRLEVDLSLAHIPRLDVDPRRARTAWLEVDPSLLHTPRLEIDPRPQRPAALVPLYASFASLQALDVHSTTRALDRGSVEANPLMKGIAGNPLALSAVKVAGATAVIYATEKMWKRNKTAAVVLMIAANTGLALVVQHNYRAGGKR